MGHKVQDSIKLAEQFIDISVQKHGARLSDAERELLWSRAAAAKQDVRQLLGARMYRSDKIGELGGPVQACDEDRVCWLAARCLADRDIIASENPEFVRLMQFALVSDSI